MMNKIQITQNNSTIKSSLPGLAARGLYLKKKGHGTAIFPVLQKLTHMIICALFVMNPPEWGGRGGGAGKTSFRILDFAVTAH